MFWSKGRPCFPPPSQKTCLFGSQTRTTVKGRRGQEVHSQQCSSPSRQNSSRYNCARLTCAPRRAIQGLTTVSEQPVMTPTQTPATCGRIRPRKMIRSDGRHEKMLGKLHTDLYPAGGIGQGLCGFGHTGPTARPFVRLASIWRQRTKTSRRNKIFRIFDMTVL